MKRSVLQNLAQFEFCDKSAYYVEPIPKYEFNDSDLDTVLNEVFSVDPVSGLPKGDIQYWLSKDGNPMVKDWLTNNLLVPRAMMTGTSIEGVTDELIAEMSHSPGESLADYQSRLKSIYDDARAQLEKSKD